MSEYKSQGGSIAGGEERTDAFVGEPKTVGNTVGGVGAAGTTSLTEKEAGTTHPHHSSGTTGTTNGVEGETKKASLLDKLNPLKDADHDGKAGFMS